MSNTANSQFCGANLRRVVVSSLIGAVIEWYDFFLYGVVAGIVFNKIYFPTTDPTVGTVLAFATFAVGFIARPLGGVIFGHFGDKLGRKKMLVLTLEIMGVATVGIGLVPSYDTIGIWAPILLVICRLAQGIGIGGDFEQVAENAKRALMLPLGTPNPDPGYAQLEEELLEAINQTGIGVQGLGGRTTCLGLHIIAAPTHIAGLPVAVNVSCHVTRHATAVL